MDANQRVFVLDRGLIVLTLLLRETRCRPAKESYRELGSSRLVGCLKMLRSVLEHLCLFSRVLQLEDEMKLLGEFETEETSVSRIARFRGFLERVESTIREERELIERSMRRHGIPIESGLPDELFSVAEKPGCNHSLSVVDKESIPFGRSEHR